MKRSFFVFLMSIGCSFVYTINGMVNQDATDLCAHMLVRDHQAQDEIIQFIDKEVAAHTLDVNRLTSESYGPVCTVPSCCNVKPQSLRWSSHTLLGFAVALGKGDVAQRLIDHRADVNAVSESDTPLLLAIRTRRFDLVQLLINNKAMVNQASLGQTPLLCAYISKDRSIINLLKSAGAIPAHCVLEQWRRYVTMKKQSVETVEKKTVESERKTRS